jgi:catechol 2,3-dioxygenase-like lactoylglutathione lyase family enzyme
MRNVSGFSHVTLNVSNLAVALRFYVDVLGMRLVHGGEHDAYLAWGSAWICVQEQERGDAATAWCGVDHRSPRAILTRL